MKTYVKWVLFACFIGVLLLIDHFFEHSNYIIIVLGVLFFIVWPIYRIVKHKHFFMSMMRDMESKIYGKPLDKKFWEKGELKNIKVKVNWRKKKE